MTAVYGGRNRYRTFVKAGRTITAKIARLDGVVGVLGTGSIGRRFGDYYSDLDLIVYAHKGAVKDLRRLISIPLVGFKGMLYDIPVEDYEQALKAPVPSKMWSQVVRWDRQNGEVLYDSDGRLKALLEEKLVYPDTERQARLTRYRRRAHEHLVFYPPMWAERGQLYHVVDSLVRGVEETVLWIYAKNKLFEPYIAKWLFFHLENGAAPESRYLPVLTEVFTGGIRSLSAAMKLRERLLGVCAEIGLDWDIYSEEEALLRGKARWEKMSPESRRILEW